MTKIIIDSTTDLPKDIMERYNIGLLPLRVFLGDKEYLDKVTIDVKEVYAAMRKGVFPKTSLPRPIDIYEIFNKYASEGNDFIFYSFSSKMSSTYQTCKLAIEELKVKYPNVKMEAVDTEGGSLASGLIAWQAAALAKEGVSFEEILKISKENINNVEHVFTIDDLSWLLKGGRVSRSGAIVGSALNIKPILDVQDGEIILINKVRGRKRSLNTVVNLVDERIDDFRDQVIGIVHADDLETAEIVKEMIKDKTGVNRIIVENIGSVLATHLGIGGVGVFFFGKKPSKYIYKLADAK